MQSIRHLKVAALACAVISTGAAQAAPKFHVTDLGTAWTNIAYPTAINESGQVVGYNNAMALLYSGGVTTTVNPVSGSPAAALGINDAGAIVGWTARQKQGASDPFELLDGQLQPLGSLGGAATVASGVNDKGQVVGWSAELFGQRHAFLSTGGKMHDLGTLPGGTWSWATAINAKGAITGQAQSASGKGHAFRYAQHRMTDLGSLVADYYSSGNAINDRGVVTGEAAIDDSDLAVTHAFVSGPDGLKDLGTLAPAGMVGFSDGLGINSAGHVVGWTQTAGSQGRAFYYDAAGMHDLNGLLDGASAGWILASATAINDANQIVGIGFFGNFLHCFLLTPVKN